MRFIERVEDQVRKELLSAESGHDWLHIQRVLRNARDIAKHEQSVDLEVVEAGALLHDIADAKFHGGDETIAPKKTREILNYVGASESFIKHIVAIVDNISYRKGSTYHSLEFKIVQDADRLDALGAIGIARMFTYGGYKNKPLYNSENVEDPISTLGHYYDKLEKLQNTLHTSTAKKIAKNRQDVMSTFVKNFRYECGLD